MKTSKKGSNSATATSSLYGRTATGEVIDIYSCTNENGLVLKMITYGATVISLEVPNRDMQISNIALCYKNFDDYLGGQSYFGSTIGRYCNRINNAQFSLNEKKYTLAANDNSNHLHGGEQGFDKVIWDASPIIDSEGVGIEFQYRSIDGEECYPGNLDVTAIYMLTNSNELKIVFSAMSDKPTPVNLTNHNYWNLGGVDSGDILDHELFINAKKYLAINNSLIPTGDLLDVNDTPFDFSSSRRVRERMSLIPQIESLPNGYDHCFILENNHGDFRTAAIVKDPRSGRSMEIFTTQPSIQFYSGNFLDGSNNCGGYRQHDGFCLETQHYPDSPNQPEFPTTILIPGEKYYHETNHRFYNE